VARLEESIIGGLAVRLWSCRAGQRPQAREGCCEGIGPRPAPWQAQDQTPGGAHEPSGDVQQALANALGLGQGELALQTEQRFDPGSPMNPTQREPQRRGRLVRSDRVQSRSICRIIAG
jgi:hypothetical protein